MAPLWLIAEREFRAYVSTLSFWAALSSPVAMAGAILLAGMAGHAEAPTQVSVRADSPRMQRSAEDALAEAAGIEGRRFVLTQPAAGGRADLSVSKAPDGGLVAEFSSEFPLSPEGRGLVLRTLERDAALKSAAGTAGLRPAIRFREATRAPRAPTDGKALFRFSLVVVLWLALTGSLGMLLQAVVRERTNRALEILLAAARPWEIVFGKLIGVGAVSLLVLGSWLGSGAALAPLSPVAGGVFPALMTGFPSRSRSFALWESMC